MQTKNTKRPLRRPSRRARTTQRARRATLDDLREAVTTLEELERTSRRVFGGSHPLTNAIEDDLQKSRDALAVFKLTAAGRGTTRADDVRSLREAVAAMTSTQRPGES